MDLAIKPREIVGKKVRALRREGLVPAEVYGHGVKNLHVTVSAKEFGKVLKEAGTNTVITLVMNTGKKSAIIHDVVKDYLSGNVQHVDFYEVRMDEKITAKIPLEFIGVASAIKDKGAVITKAMSEIEVEALPQNLPHTLIVDLALLDDINKSVYVRDIAIPMGVEILIDAETAIASSSLPVEEEVVVAPIEVTDVKVETEEKKIARDAEKPEKEI